MLDLRRFGFRRVGREGGFARRTVHKPPELFGWDRENPLTRWAKHGSRHRTPEAALQILGVGDPNKKERRNQGRSRGPDQGANRTARGPTLPGRERWPSTASVLQGPEGPGWSFLWKQRLDANASFKLSFEALVGADWFPRLTFYAAAMGGQLFKSNRVLIGSQTRVQRIIWRISLVVDFRLGLMLASGNRTPSHNAVDGSSMPLRNRCHVRRCRADAFSLNWEGRSANLRPLAQC
jgi:hypothetical protein